VNHFSSLVKELFFNQKEASSTEGISATQSSSALSEGL
jgi:hypothetical protein